MRLRNEKIYTLMYADGVALTAEEDMRSMISRLERYLDTKGLTLSTENKNHEIQKRGREEENVRVEMKGKMIEEAKEFKYLGYIVKENGGQETHIRERRRKAAIAMGEVWGIGKRM